MQFYFELQLNKINFHINIKNTVCLSERFFAIIEIVLIMRRMKAHIHTIYF